LKIKKAVRTRTLTEKSRTEQTALGMTTTKT